MTTMHKNVDVRTLALGIRVRRAAAQLPQAAVGDLFTVTVGRIKVLQLIGEYTVAADADGSTLIARYLSPLAGAANTPFSIVSAALASAVKTSHLWLPSDPAAALESDLTGFGGTIPIVGHICPPGKVQIDASATSQHIARVQWDLYYVPVDVGAKVVAA